MPFLSFQPREPNFVEIWLKQHLGWDVAPRMPSGDFDTDATPVLLELLTSPHEQARLLAMKSLQPDARAAIPELQRLALATQSLWEYRYAVEALERIDPTAAVPERDLSKLSWW
jgi:hypothetical protein